MKAKKIVLMVVCGLLCLMVAKSEDIAVPGANNRGYLPERNHSFYVGFGFGPTQLKLANNERNIEGINFKFNAQNNDLGGEAHAGYWITDNVGLEIGGRTYGKTKAPFSFSDPHDNTTGTGESEVQMSGFNVSLVLGVDIVPRLQLFVRGGALMWTESYESRFDIPGQAAMHRTYQQSGAGYCVGAGVSFRIANDSGWALQVQVEQSNFWDDTVTMVSGGLTYDLIGLIR